MEKERAGSEEITTSKKMKSDGIESRRKKTDGVEPKINESDGVKPKRKRVRKGHKGTEQGAKQNGSLEKDISKRIDVGHKKKRPWGIAVFWVIVIIAVVIILLRGCSKDIEDLLLDMPEFEDSVGFGNVDAGEGNSEKMELPVIPDFTVSAENPNFVIPYPKNAYDVEFSFVDAESGAELYHTKRIRPGTTVEIPAFSFCKDGEHTYRIEVGVYDRDTYMELPSAVALEMNITKE